MNITEHLLTCLAEEAAEVAQDCCKSLRFGLDDRNVNDPHGPTNRQRLLVELNQLVAVINMLVDRGVLPWAWQDANVQREKIYKVREFMIYATGVGALQPDPPKQKQTAKGRDRRSAQSASKKGKGL